MFHYKLFERAAIQKNKILDVTFRKRLKTSGLYNQLSDNYYQKYIDIHRYVIQSIHWYYESRYFIFLYLYPMIYWKIG